MLEQLQLYRQALTSFETALQAEDSTALETDDRPRQHCPSPVLYGPCCLGQFPARIDGMYTTEFLDLPSLASAAGSVRLPGSKD